jgi:hypothetical protein
MWIEVKWFDKLIPRDSVPYRTTNYFTAGQEDWLKGIITRNGSALLTGSPNEHVLVWSADLYRLRSQRWGDTVTGAAFLGATDRSVARFLASSLSANHGTASVGRRRSVGNSKVAG